jgi:hypothetical protein
VPSGCGGVRKTLNTSFNILFELLTTRIGGERDRWTTRCKRNLPPGPMASVCILQSSASIISFCSIPIIPKNLAIKNYERMMSSITNNITSPDMAMKIEAVF